MESPRPPESPQKVDRSSLAPVGLALLAAVACFIVLFFLSGGFFAVVVVVGGGLALVAALHYVVWGWWLGQIINREEAEDNEGPQDGAV